MKTRVLVTGATGYVGGRLVPGLLAQGYEVVCLVRRAEKLACRTWRSHPDLRVVEGSIEDESILKQALEGCKYAYYLVHSMESAAGQYAERDRKLAESFLKVSDQTDLDRIVYLGGLGEHGPGLSKHLRSRREVEEVLHTGRIPVTSFRAAVIIGVGSASFEILRYLVERLPIMITPKWVKTETQPISIDNVLHYLIACLEVPETKGQKLDIGGTSILTYQEMMQITAKELGLPRRIIMPVPVLTPKLSSLWIGLVTPVSTRIARPLAEGLRNKTVCNTNEAALLMPQTLHSAEEAIAIAMNHTNEGEVETNWSMAGEIPGDPDWAGGKVFEDRREKEVQANAETVFNTVCTIGGDKGYWGADFLWRIRGLMDQLIGGPGLKRGRRHPTELVFGEAIDFWRVRKIKAGQKLTLHAEMWLPGEAELDFEIVPIDEHNSRLIQTARFRPKGLLGLVYWYAVAPFHYFVFQYMIDGIARESKEAEQLQQANHKSDQFVDSQFQELNT